MSVNEVPTAGLAELRAASAARAEHEGLSRQRDLLEQRVAAARARVADARAQVSRERSDVERLDSRSLTRIWATLKGSRDDDLSRERAEAEAAAYSLAEAEGTLTAETAVLSDVENRIASLGEVAVRYEAARAAREAEVRADPVHAKTHELLDLAATTLGRIDVERQELDEAAAAAAAARNALEAAANALDSAQGWATYDTFFGGGLLADMAKHDRMGEASALIRTADTALGVLGAELADVGVGALGELQLDQLHHAFDVWFDSFFADYAVRERVRAASRQIASLTRAVNAISDIIDTRVVDAERRRTEVLADRESLLHSGPHSS